MKHYRAAFDTEYDFGSFAFSTPDQIYYNDVSDRVCFQGPYIEESDSQICACIGGYMTRRLAINVWRWAEQENYADGEKVVDLICETDDWYHDGMNIALYYCSEKIDKGDRYHFVDFDTAKMSKEGSILAGAKEELEKQIHTWEIWRNVLDASHRSKLLEKAKQEGKAAPEVDDVMKLRGSIIRLVSLVRDS